VEALYVLTTAADYRDLQIRGAADFVSLCRIFIACCATLLLLQLALDEEDYHRDSE